MRGRGACLVPAPAAAGRRRWIPAPAASGGRWRTPAPTAGGGRWRTPAPTAPAPCPTDRTVVGVGAGAIDAEHGDRWGGVNPPARVARGAVPDARVVTPVEAVRVKDRNVVVRDHLDARRHGHEIRSVRVGR